MRKKGDFSKVFEDGTTFTNGLIVLKMASNQLSVNRFGITVSRRVGNAVTRNKAKRRLKEIVRTLQIKQGWDVVLIARPQIKPATYSDIRWSTVDLFQRAKLLDPQTKV